MFGNFGEVSEATHALVDALATSRARVAEPQTGKRGKTLTEQGVKAMAVGYIRRRLGVAAVKAQCLSLLGRVEGLGPGAVSAAGKKGTGTRAIVEQRAESSSAGHQAGIQHHQARFC